MVSRIRHLIPRSRSERGEISSTLVLAAALVSAAMLAAPLITTMVTELTDNIATGEVPERGERQRPDDGETGGGQPVDDPPYDPYPIPEFPADPPYDPYPIPEFPADPPYDPYPIPEFPEDQPGDDEPGDQNPDDEPGDEDPDDELGDDELSPEEALEQLREMGPIEWAELLDVARKAGDTAEFERLSELYLAALDGLGADEARRYLHLVGDKNSLLVLASSGGTTHPGVLAWLNDYSIRSKLAGGGTDDPSDLSALAEQVFRDVLAQPGAIEAFYDLTKNGSGRPHGPDLANALHQYLIDNPDQLHKDVINAQRGSAFALQNLLESLGDHVSDAGMTELMDNYIASQAPKIDLSDPIELAHFASGVGQLQYQIGEVGSQATYDLKGILLHVAGKVPVAGDAISAVNAAISGYTADPTYENLADEDRRNRENTLLAMAVAIAADPSLADEISGAFDGSGWGPVEAWLGEGSKASTLVGFIANEIEDGAEGNKT